MPNLFKINQFLCISICLLTFLCGCGNLQDEEKGDIQKFGLDKTNTQTHTYSSTEANTEKSDFSKLPEDLIFDGKPLDPGVIDSIASGDSSHFEPKKIQDCINKDLKRPGGGYFEYEYIPECYLDGDRELFCYCSWNYIGTLDDGKTHVINAESWDAGGTGRFSYVFLMQRNGDFVQNIKDLEGGDRGSRGIVKVFFKDNTVFIKQRLTHNDFFKTCVRMLASEDSTIVFDSDYTDGYIKYKNIKIPCQIYAKLPDCCVEWFGTIKSSWKNNSLEIIESKLEPYKSYDDDEKVDENIFFACNLPLFNQCFNAVESRYARPSRKKLGRNDMKRFAREVLDLYLQKSNLDV